jgi:hypothetical protein
MSSTFGSVLDSVRRAADRIIPPRLRLPRPPVTSGPGGSGPVVGEGPVNQLDRALEPYTEMALAIAESVNLGEAPSGGFY